MDIIDDTLENDEILDVIIKQKKEKEDKKEDKVALALKELDKKYGEGTVITHKGAVANINVISTGSFALDRATGVGGYPTGRIIEIFGPESSGKSTLCLHAVKEAQIKFPNKKALYIDMEHTLDLKYAKQLGVDVDKLMIAQPSFAEEGLEIADTLIATGEMSIVVIDSVAALVPKSEIERDMGESTMGVQARLMSQACRKLTAITQKANTILLFTNQIREKIGVMFGNPETTTGGNALKFYASIRIDVRRIKPATPQEAEGNQVNVTVVKNKVARPFNKCKFDILWGYGIDRAKEIFDFAVEYDIINKSGSWYSYNGDKLGQGAEAAKKMLDDNPEVWTEIEDKLNEKMKNEL